MSHEHHIARRRRLIDSLGSGMILVRGHAPGGTSPSFYFLTGIHEPAAVLVLARDGVRIGTGRQYPGPDYVRGRMVQQVLFLPAPDPLAARWGEDGSATLGSVRPDDLGVDAIFGLGELNALLTQWLSATRVVHLVRGTSPSLLGDLDADAAFAERVRGRFLGVELRDATPAVHELRRLKDAAEVAAIRTSITVTGEALAALLGRMQPGVREHELEAELVRVYRAHDGAHAFAPIVACGANALKLHYDENRSALEPGQLLLVDTGVEIDGYRSDITRTFPVDGRFTPRQREVYETVLRAQREAIALCRPGSTLGEIHARAFEVVAQAGFGAYLPHGTGHHLGLETHDVGDVHRPLDAGAVVTIEPGIYIPDEAIGVRIEDDVLVTAGEPEVLSAAIPREFEAVERWVAERRR